jgi:CheY-like chemotaxis protein
MMLRLGRMPPYRILVADDCPAHLRFVAEILQSAGAEVVLAENGQALVDLAVAATQAGTTFNLILTDIQMPVMDGCEATRQLRKMGHTEPIIALTASPVTDGWPKCLDCGCDDFMTKPLDPSTFAAVIAKYLA